MSTDICDIDSLLFLCGEFRRRADALEFKGDGASASIYRECATSVDTWSKEMRRQNLRQHTTIKRLNERAQRAEAALAALGK